MRLYPWPRRPPALLATAENYSWWSWSLRKSQELEGVVVVDLLLGLRLETLEDHIWSIVVPVRVVTGEAEVVREVILDHPHQVALAAGLIDGLGREEEPVVQIVARPGLDPGTVGTQLPPGLVHPPAHGNGPCEAPLDPHELEVRVTVQCPVEDQAGDAGPGDLSPFDVALDVALGDPAGEHRTGSLEHRLTGARMADDVETVLDRSLEDRIVVPIAEADVLNGQEDAGDERILAVPMDLSNGQRRIERRDGESIGVAIVLTLPVIEDVVVASGDQDGAVVGIDGGDRER